MNENKYGKLKLVFAIILSLIGCFGAYMTYDMIIFLASYAGVPVGLGVFSGLSLIASAKLLSELK